MNWNDRITALHKMVESVNNYLFLVERDQKIGVITDLAKKCLHIPYRWAGQDPFTGFDCSGLIVYLLRCAGVMQLGEDYTAEQLRHLYPKVQNPDEGILVYYGKVTAKHVMYCISDTHCIGAVAGTENINTRQAAELAGAMVDLRPITYRTDILGYNRPFTIPKRED